MTHGSVTGIDLIWHKTTQNNLNATVIALLHRVTNEVRATNQILIRRNKCHTGLPVAIVVIFYRRRAARLEHFLVLIVLEEKAMR